MRLDIYFFYSSGIKMQYYLYKVRKHNQCKCVTFAVKNDSAKLFHAPIPRRGITYD